MTPLPYREEAEAALLGDLLLGFTGCHEDVVARVCSSDFYVPSHGALFNAIVTLYRRGDRVDVLSVDEELRRAGEPQDPARLYTLQNAGTSAWKRHAEIVLDRSLRRRVISATEEIAEAARDVSRDPADVLDSAKAVLGGIDLPIGGLPSDLHDGDTFADTAELTPPEWVLPGLVRRGWRVVVVAFEGTGKSVLFTSLGTALTRGRHALTGATIAPQPVLLIDLENPAEVLGERIRTTRSICRTDRQARLAVWHRPRGINLRSRSDRAELEAILLDVKPALVCLGPLYKAYRPEGRERDEEAAGQVQGILDDLRDRFNFGLLMEHHAPHADGYSKRQARPFGSSLWLRWPELGLALTKHEVVTANDKALKDSLDVGNWRGDRVKHTWPDRLDRGGVGEFPWVAYRNNPTKTETF